jgi:PHD/YefM family antitoxin component YafN of YafNO toxin-antitoxin module
MEGRLSESDFEELQATLKQLDEGIFEQLSRIRDERASGW